jgi:hypothetical protein
MKLNSSLPCWMGAVFEFCFISPSPLPQPFENDAGGLELFTSVNIHTKMLNYHGIP